MDLAAASAAEARKSSRYAPTANLHGRLLTFALETYGGFGKQAFEVLRIIEARSRTVPSMDAARVKESIAICLQRGNSHVLQAGAIATRVADLNL